MFNFFKKKKERPDATETEFHYLHATSNRDELSRSNKAGCFSCKEIFNANEIKDWVGDKRGDTAICPYCGIDSVYGDASGRIVDVATLKRMNKMWF